MLLINLTFCFQNCMFEKFYAFKSSWPYLATCISSDSIEISFVFIDLSLVFTISTQSLKLTFHNFEVCYLGSNKLISVGAICPLLHNNPLLVTLQWNPFSFPWNSTWFNTFPGSLFFSTKLWTLCILPGLSLLEA